LAVSKRLNHGRRAAGRGDQGNMDALKMVVPGDVQTRKRPKHFKRKREERESETVENPLRGGEMQALSTKLEGIMVGWGSSCWH